MCLCVSSKADSVVYVSGVLSKADSVVYVSGVLSKAEQCGGVERAIVSGGPQLEQRLPVLDIRKHAHVVFADG